MTDLLQPFKKLRDDNFALIEEPHDSYLSWQQCWRCKLDAAIAEAEKLLADQRELLPCGHPKVCWVTHLVLLPGYCSACRTQHEAVAKATEKMDKLLLSVLDGYCAIGRARDHYKAILAERGKQ